MSSMPANRRRPEGRVEAAPGATATTEKKKSSSSTSSGGGGGAQVKRTRILSDAEWVSAMPEDEAAYFRANAKDSDFLEEAKVLCTCCAQQVNHKQEDMVARHPILGVVMCKRCKAFYFGGVWRRDEDGYFEHCRWCANGGELICCANAACKSAFCKRCIKRNLGRNKVSEAEESEDWRCLSCDLSQVRELRLMYYSVYQYWQREKGREEAKEARRLEREAKRQDVVSKLQKEADEVSRALKEGLFLRKKAWMNAKEKHGDCPPAEVRIDALNAASSLRRLINKARRGLGELDKKVVEAMSESYPGGRVGGGDVAAAEEEEEEVGGGEEDLTSGGDKSSQESMDCSSPSVGPNPASVTNGTSEGSVGASGDSSRVAKKTDHPAGDSKSGVSLLTPKPGPSPAQDGGDKEGNSSVVNVVVKKKEEKKELKPEPVAEPEETEEKVNGVAEEVGPKAEEMERIKREVLQSSSSSSDEEDGESAAVKGTTPQQRKGQKSKRITVANGNSKDDEGVLEEEEASPKTKGKKKHSPSPASKKKPRAIASDGDDDEVEEVGDDGDDNLGLGTDSDTPATDPENSDTEFKVDKAELQRSRGGGGKKPVEESRFGKLKRVTAETKLRRRYRKLIREVDLATDPKLTKSRAAVACAALSPALASALNDGQGTVAVADFPDLERLMRGKPGRGNKNVSFDAEIDRLCDLSALENSRKKKGSSSQEESEEEEDKKVVPAAKRGRGRPPMRMAKKNHKLIEMSSGEEEEDVAEDLSDEECVGRGEKKNDKAPTANELAKAAVLATSSSEGEEETEEGKEEKGKKREKKSKSEAKDSKEKEDGSGDGKRVRKKKSDPAFMRIKLSESEEEEEDVDAGKKKRGRKAKKEEEAEDEEPIAKKGRGRPRKKKVVSSDDGRDSDIQEVKDDDDDDDDDGGDGDDGSDFNPEDSDSDVVVKKRGKKRKKGSSSEDDDSSSEEDDSEDDSEENSDDDDDEDGDGKKKKKKKGKKKKRKRIKKAGSSSEDEDGDSKSPGKGRHNIRKIISDKKVSKETKSAALVERDRRKRMEERQKLYNQEFEVKKGDTPKELPLDFDTESKKVLVEVDKKLLKKMKPHQAGGVRFMWDAVFETKKDVKKGKVPGGAILAHCMGLGKTLQTIVLIHTVHTNFPTVVQRTLVLSPVNTVKNWEHEFEIWLKGDMEMDVYEMSGEKDNWGRADRLGQWRREGGVMIMGYDMFRNLTNEQTKKFKKKQKEVFKDALVDPGPDLVVCDEGHVLKNLKSALNNAMNKIKTRRRIILTGTPLQNNLAEYYAMVNFVKPQLLGTFNEFKNRFVNPIQNGQHSDSTERDVRVMKKRSFILNDLLKGCMQRLDYNVLVPYLQPKHEYVLCISLTDFQKKLYKFYLENYARAGQIGSDGKLEGGKKGGLFYDCQNLSRVWNHPYILKMAKTRADLKRMFEDNDEEGSLKDFIDDDDASEACSTDSGGDDDEVELLEEDEEAATSRRANTRNAKDKEELVGGLDEAKEEELEAQKGWWHQFLENEEDLEKVELGSKMILLLDILRECELMGDKVLVFSQSLLSLDLIEDFLQRIAPEKGENKEEANTSGISYLGSWKHGRDYFRMDGSTQPENRKKWCNYFNKKSNHQMRLFLISTKAGGLGINLVAANRVIIFDASWNPAHDVQSIFRVYRFGQEKPVYIYRFLAKGTMEEKIYDRQVSKQSLSARVVDEHQIERHFSMNELAELYEFNDEPKEARPLPKVPKDLLLADLLKKHEDMIWKYHDHDSLLENQVDENLTEEERKAAWEEFENEKKGLYGVANNPAIQNAIATNINPAYIQEQYRLQYPHLTEEQVAHATKAYIMQLQSGITRKPAYDKSHYQEEMARAKAQQMSMYPGMYSQRQQNTVQQQLQQMRQSEVNYQASTSARGRDDWTSQVLNQQRQYQERMQQERAKQAQQIQQAYLRQMQEQAARLLEQRRAAQGGAPVEITLDDDGDAPSSSGGGGGAAAANTIELDGMPEFAAVSPPKSFPAPGTSRRGRPRLDPDTDTPLGEVSHGARAMQQMRELAAQIKKRQQQGGEP